MKILVIDNYDSFTYNLVQYIERVMPGTVTVTRNDRMEVEEAAAFDKILVSPGPGIPEEAGISKALIERFGQEKSILGVCLGHQAIAEVYGGTIRNLDRVYHGVASVMVRQEKESAIFRGVPEVFEAGRYHSWIVEETGLPGSLEVTVRNKEGQIMGLRHRTYDVTGVQFHPESVLTEYGGMMIKNWLSDHRSNPGQSPKTGQLPKTGQPPETGQSPKTGQSEQDRAPGDHRSVPGQSSSVNKNI